MRPSAVELSLSVSRLLAIFKSDDGILQFFMKLKAGILIKATLRLKLNVITV